MAGSSGMDGAGVARIAQWSAVGQVRRGSAVFRARHFQERGGGRRRSNVRHHTEGRINVPHRFDVWHRFEAKRARALGFAAERSLEDELGG